jgi:hypothetical protein
LRAVLLSARIVLGKFKDEIIQSSSQVLDALTDGETQGHWNDVRISTYHDLLRTVIVVENEALVIHLADSVNFGDELPKVFIGPVDPYTGSV